MLEKPSKRWREILIALAAVFVVVCAQIARLFIWPDQGMPSRVNAIVILDGPGDALNVAVRLAVQHRTQPRVRPSSSAH